MDEERNQIVSLEMSLESSHLEAKNPSNVEQTMERTKCDSNNNTDDGGSAACLKKALNIMAPIYR